MNVKRKQQQFQIRSRRTGAGGYLEPAIGVNHPLHDCVQVNLMHYSAVEGVSARGQAVLTSLTGSERKIGGKESPDQ